MRAKEAKNFREYSLIKKIARKEDFLNQAQSSP